MITMHSRWHPSGTVEITPRNQPARMEQEDDLAITAVSKEKSKLAQLPVRQDTPTLQTVQQLRDFRSRTVREEPEARHGGVVHRNVISRHRQIKRLHILQQI